MELTKGSTITVLSPSGAERECGVIEVKADKVKIHYKGFNEKFDEWLPIGSDRIQAIKLIKVEEDEEDEEDEEEAAAWEAAAPDLAELDPYLTGVKATTGRDKFETGDVSMAAAEETTPGGAALDSYNRLVEAARRGSEVQSSKVGASGVQASAPKVAELAVGTEIAVISKTGNERACTVTAMEGTQVKIHYIGFEETFDEWLAVDSDRIQVDKRRLEVATEEAPVAPRVAAAPLQSDESNSQAAVGEANGAEVATNEARVVSGERAVPKTSEGGLKIASNEAQAIDKEIAATAAATFSVGAQLVVVSRTNKERECTVVDVKGIGVKIHYNGFDDSFDEWLPVRSGRIQNPVSASQDVGENASFTTDTFKPEQQENDDSIARSDDLDYDMGDGAGEGSDEVRSGTDPPMKMLKRGLWRCLSSASDFQSLEYVDAINSLIRGDVLDTDLEYENALQLIAKRQRDPSVVRKILSAMWYNGHMPDTKHYTWGIYAAMKRRKSKLAMELLEEMQENDIPADRQTYNNVIFAIAKDTGSSKYLAASQVFEDMRRSGVPQDKITYLAVLSACEEGGHWIEALQFFEQMLNAGIVPEVKHFNALMWTCGNARQFARVLQIHRQMKEAEMRPDVVTFMAIMNACKKVGQYDEAVRVSKELEKSGLELDGRAHSHILEAYLNADLPRNVMDRFDELVGRTKREEVVMVPLAYLTAIKACGKLRDVDRALELLREAKTNRFKNKAKKATYEAAAIACESAEEWDKMVAVIKDMEKAGFKPGYELASAYASLLGGLAYDGRGAEAYNLFQDMMRKSLPINAGTYRSAIVALESEGRHEQAKQLEEQMVSHMSKRYTKAIGRYGHSGQWQGAIDVFEKAKEDGITPGVITRNALISACAKSAQWEKALEILDGFETDGLEPDVITYTSVINALIRAERPLEEIEKVWDRMKAAGVEPSYLFYRIMIQELEVQGEWEKALTLWDEMRTKGEKPCQSTYNAVIAACEAGKLWEPIVEIFEEMKDLGLDLGTANSGPSRSVAIALKELGQEERLDQLIEEVKAMKRAARLAKQAAKEAARAR